VKRYLSSFMSVVSFRCATNCALLVWILCFCIPLQAQTEKYNMTRGATDISQQVYHLHMTIFYICCVIGAIVFALMFWAIVYHRKSRGAKAAQFHGSLKIELLWTAIPVVILVVMAGIGDRFAMEVALQIYGLPHRFLFSAGHTA
jgi:cytochrome c oxidase subunit II